MSAPRRGAARARRVQPSRQPIDWSGPGGVALIAFGLLSGLALLRAGGPALNGLAAMAWAVLGIACPLAALVPLAWGVLVFRPAARPPRSRLQAAAAALASLLGLATLIWAPAGGVVGAIALSLVAWAGDVASVVVLGAGLVVASALTLGPHGHPVASAALRLIALAAELAAKGQHRRVAENVFQGVAVVVSTESAPGDEPGALAIQAEMPDAEEDHVPEQANLDGAQADLALEDGWRLPPLRLLAEPTPPILRSREELEATERVIEDTFDQFGMRLAATTNHDGPSVTQYALHPQRGLTVQRVTRRHADLELALNASPLRFESPVTDQDGRAAIGLEVPKTTSTLVTIREGIEAAAGARQVLGIVLGNDITGRPVSHDLVRMVHLLIAGATGQGKSVCLNTSICSLLMRLDPTQLRLVMIDPKRVELQGYGGLPHLAVPVIVEADQAATALAWAVGEVERRYKLLAREDVRDLAAYNVRPGVERIPYVVIVIDEFADLVMVAGDRIMELVCRLAQKARAVGVHLVIATQRPDATVVSGLLKANVPSRLALAVGSQVDSRVILDTGGAEKLIGRGDMLFLPIGASKPVRLQGAFISDPEIESLVNWWRDQGEPEYLDEVLRGEVRVEPKEERRLDPLFAQAARVVATEGTASVSLVQRKLTVGYSRAGRIVDQLAEHRVIGPYQGSKSREVLMNLPDVDRLLQGLPGGKEAT